jgi:SAM-dependent methyltransferase
VIPCLLCRSVHTEVVEIIDGLALNRQWERSLGLQGPLQAQRLSYLRCRECELGYFDPVEAAGPELYAELQQFDWYYMSEKPEFTAAVPYLDGTESVLEIGAGSGSFSAYVSGRRYRGLEFNQRAVAEARAMGRDVINADLELQAGSDDAFDAVVAFQVLEHASDPRRVIANALRCLNAGGRLIIAVPTMEGFVGSAVNAVLNLPPHHTTHWRDRTLRAISHVFDLDLIALDYEPVSEFHEEWARQVMVERRLRQAFGLGRKLVDDRARARAGARLSQRFAGLTSGTPKTVGHSVLAVYQGRERTKHGPK